MFRRTAVALMAAVVVVGLPAACTQSDSGPVPSTSIETRLDDAMRRASIASARVAGIEIAAAGDFGNLPADPAPADVPDELRRRISVDWTGPAGPLVGAIAEQVGYGFAETGPAPAAPVILTLHRRDEEAWRVLRDAGIGLRTAAKITVNAPSRLMELRWPQPGRR